MPQNIKQFSAGYSRSVVLFDNEKAWAWGNIGRVESTSSDDLPLASVCGSGPLEIGHNRYAQPIPQLLNPDSSYIFIADALNGLMVLDSQGQTMKVASVTSLKSGAATLIVAGLFDGMHQVCGNESASYAIDGQGQVWSWGNNFQGQLGRLTSADSLSQAPARIKSLSNVMSVAAGKNHALALTERGEVWAWGANSAGQLGQGDLNSLNEPTRVRINSRIRSIAAGDTHSLALDYSGNLYAWGSNNCGQLGPLQSSKKVDWSSFPVRVPLSFKLQQVDAGMHYTLALTDQGEVYAWGWNSFGQLGTSSAKMTGRPTRISGITRAEKISAGAFHALALHSNGLYAWGDNRNSACGIASTQAAVVTKPNLIKFL
jgi:alpha-tubulin suppressor-like RCC1 family protein